MFNFECLDISWALIVHPSQNLWLFEFVQSFCVQFWTFRYIIDLNHTSNSKVMTVWIFLGIRCSILRFSLYYGSQEDIQVKSYGSFNFPRASMFNFKLLDIPWASIIHLSKNLWPFELARRFHVQFRAPRYIMVLKGTSESKVMVVQLCQKFSCSISSILI